MQGLQTFKNIVLKNGIHYVTSDYKTRNNLRKNHNGIDIVSHNNRNTTTDYVTSIDQGIVKATGYDKNAGYYVKVKHNNGHISVYFHLKKGTIKVKKNDKILKGEILAYMGNTGHSTGAHLHFGVHNGNSYIDPLPYLKGEKSLNNDEPKKNTISVDGVWGQATTKKAQKVFGTPVDGKVSEQYKVYQNKNKGLLSTTFEWKNNPKNGSLLIKNFQKMIGVPVDGFIGPNTIRNMQKYFGTPQDGMVSNPSLMIKEFQKWLNKQ